MPFKIHFGDKFKPGHVWLWWQDDGAEGVRLILPDRDTHVLKLLRTANTLTLQVSASTSAYEFPLDAREQILCRGRGGRWDFPGERRPFMPPELTADLLRHLEETLCLE